jgi:hypothetical protein
MIYRRSVLKGLAALFVAPAIIRVENLMPIKEYMPEVPAWCPEGWLPCDGRKISRKFYPDLCAMFERMRIPLKVPNYEVDAPLQGYDGGRINSIKTVISYKTLVRPNGKLMQAGACHPVYVPGTMVELKT